MVTTDSFILEVELSTLNEFRQTNGDIVKTNRLRIDDIEGSYSIPYIQSDRHLAVRINFREDAIMAAQVSLAIDGRTMGETRVRRNAPLAKFQVTRRVNMILLITGFDAGGKAVCRRHEGRIGIGTILAALGDSITEGYYGKSFWRDNLDLEAEMFPSEAVSKDGRNFPQYSPTSEALRNHPTVRAVYKEPWNCLQSWMTSLNDGLADAWKHPVFIANEGWAGSTSGSYREMIQKDQGWQRRMRQLRPRLWLIHLGVNDEHGKIVDDVFSRNLEDIVDTLMDEYHADPKSIFIAKPCYDYDPCAEGLLKAYCARIVQLVDKRGLSHGPDFFTAYSKDKDRLYGNDLVHPNPTGMALMGKLWKKVLVSSFRYGSSTEFVGQKGGKEKFSEGMGRSISREEQGGEQTENVGPRKQ